MGLSHVTSKAMIRAFLVAGTRPNFIKIAPLFRAFNAHPGLQPSIVHTGQHYDHRMNDVFFRQLELPKPHYYLGIGSGTHAQQTADVMVALETLLLKQKPDVVVVVGDVNSTLAATLAAVKLHIPVAHVEAGLRSFDRRMPEEINRLVTDTLASWLYVTEQSGLDNLQNEGLPPNKIFLAGNVMMDSLVRFRAQAASLNVIDHFGLAPRSYVLMTMHRPSNVDSPERLRTIIEALASVTALHPVVFPVHPRTQRNLELHGYWQSLSEHPHLHLIKPLGYLEFMSLMMDARILVTDSGGVQEEATFLGVPCATVRESTERPVTITHGTNELLPLSVTHIEHAVSRAFSGSWKTGITPPLWDGHAAERIADHLAQQF